MSVKKLNIEVARSSLGSPIIALSHAPSVSKGELAWRELALFVFGWSRAWLKKPVRRFYYWDERNTFLYESNARRFDGR